MPTLRDLQTAVAAPPTDTLKSKITVAIVGRVLKRLWEVLAERPEFIPVVQRQVAKAQQNSTD